MGKDTAAQNRRQQIIHQPDGIRTPPEAGDLLWSLFSINNWEHLTIECGWTQAEYIARLKIVSKRAFVEEAA